MPHLSLAIPKDEIKQMTEQAWANFFNQVQGCTSCKGIASHPNGCTRDVRLVNPLTDQTAMDWGIYWYDDYRNLAAPIMIVGMDFGDKPTIDKYRVNRRRPSTLGQDKTYVKLRSFIEAAGLGGEVYLTNSALCVRDDENASGELANEVYENCLAHLRAQIEVIEPSIIVPLGERALRQVLKALDTMETVRTLWGDMSITRYAGQDRRVVALGRELIIFPVVHPAFEQYRKSWPDEWNWRYPRQQEVFARLCDFL